MSSARHPQHARTLNKCHSSCFKEGKWRVRGRSSDLDIRRQVSRQLYSLEVQNGPKHCAVSFAWQVVLPPFCRWENWISEWLEKVTGLQVGFEPRMICLQTHGINTIVSVLSSNTVLPRALLSVRSSEVRRLKLGLQLESGKGKKR